MKLDAQWIVGFVDGEGCFHVSVNAHPGMSAGAQVLPEFTVVQHERDVQVLHALKAYFGCGVVRKNHGDRMAYRVRRGSATVGRTLSFHSSKSILSSPGSASISRSSATPCSD